MKRTSLHTSTLTAATLIVAGCANVTGTPFKNGEAANGVYVNGAASILVADATGVRPISIADPCYRYALNFNALLAKNVTKVMFNENGTLKSLDANLDSTDFAKALPDIVDAVNKKVGADRAQTVMSETKLFSFRCVDGEIVLNDAADSMLIMNRALAFAPRNDADNNAPLPQNTPVTKSKGLKDEDKEG